MTIPPKTKRPTLTTKSSTKKPEAKKAAAPKPTMSKPTALKPAVPKPVAGTTKPAADGAGRAFLRKKELIERVMAKVSVKKKDAKPVIEAMLEVLGEAIENGDDLNLQPMGKLINKRMIDKPNAKIIICRLRRRKDVAKPAVVNVLK